MVLEYRKLRSIRGSIQYALEIIEDEKKVTVLKTNFQSLFWKKISNVLKQNRNEILLEFLFKTNELYMSNDSDSIESANQIQNILYEIEDLKEELKRIEKKIA